MKIWPFGRNFDFSWKNSTDIVKDIIETGLACREKGVKKVSISSLLCRSDMEEMNKVNEINDLLKQRCAIENFGFISNEAIRENHLWKNGIHLIDQGTTIFANNFINVLNNVNLFWLRKQESYEASQISSNKKIYDYIEIDNKNLKNSYNNIENHIITACYEESKAENNKLASSVMARPSLGLGLLGHARQTYGESLCGPQAYRCIDPVLINKTRTYETSQSCDRVHLGHWKKKIEKKF